MHGKPGFRFTPPWAIDGRPRWGRLSRDKGYSQRRRNRLLNAIGQDAGAPNRCRTRQSFIRRLRRFPRIWIGAGRTRNMNWRLNIPDARHGSRVTAFAGRAVDAPQPTSVRLGQLGDAPLRESGLCFQNMLARALRLVRSSGPIRERRLTCAVAELRLLIGARASCPRRRGWALLRSVFPMDRAGKMPRSKSAVSRMSSPHQAQQPGQWYNDRTR